MTYGHSSAPIRIFGPAIAGAFLQLVAVALITTVFYLLARARYFSLGWPLSICADSKSCESAALLVRLSYLLTAIGVALTDNRFIVQAQLWARDASRAPRGEGSRFLAEAVAVQLSIVAIASLVEALDSPMHAIVALGQWLGGIWLGAILWPAMWSVVIAATGCLIHALYLSTQRMLADR